MTHIFSKVLKKVDAAKQMAVPTRFMQHLPPHAGGYTLYFQVTDLSGKVWWFGYYVRGGGSPHAKPVFQGEWRQFVSEKNLVTGDRITFRVERDAAGVPTYTIAAQKSLFKLFGQVVFGSEF